MKKYNVTDARKKFADLLDLAAWGGERVVIEKHGRPVAAIVPVADLENLPAGSGQVPEPGYDLFELVRDRIDQGVIAFGPDLVIRFSNRRAAELNGLDPAVIAAGKSFAEVIRIFAKRGDYGPGDPEALEREYTALAGNEAPVDLERVRADGTVLGVKAWPLRDGGQIVLYSDVTSRARAEAELDESRQRLATVGWSLPGVIYRRVLHPDGSVSYPYMSEGAKALYGVSPEEVRADPGCFFDRIHPDDLGALLEAVRQSGETLEPYDHEFRMFAEPGEVRWIRSIARPGRRQDGGVVWDGITLDVTESRKIREDFEVSERRFRDIATAASDHFWETDAEHRFTMLFGRPDGLAPSYRDRVLGKTRMDLAGADVDRQPWKDHMADLAARRPFRDFRYQLVGEQGEILHLSISGTPFFDNDGEFLGYRGAATDITEQVLAVEQIQRHETRFQALLDHAPAIIYLKDMEGRYQVVNREFEAYYNVRNEDMVGHNLAELFPAHAAPAYQRTDDQVLATGDVVETELVDPYDESNRVLHVVKFPVRDANGTIIAIGGIETNITDRKQAEEALQATTELQRHLLDYSPAIIAIRDTAGRFQLVNRAYEKMFDLRNEEVKGKTIAEVMPAGFAVDLEEFDRKVLKTGEPLVHEHEAAHKSGPRTLLSVRFPIHDAAGRIVGVGSMATDITGRKQAEKALLEAKEHAEFANRAKSEFLANMSHELRTPLNAVIGFSELMIAETFGPLGNARYLDYLRDINQSGAHLLSLINDILDLSKIEAGKADLHEEDILIQELVAGCIRIVSARETEQGVPVRSDIPAGIPAIRADDRAMRQILINLLSNALKFTVNGEIVVTAGLRGDGGMAITVRDTGVGMNEDEVGIALTLFGQVDGSLARRNEGTGLGLPLVRSLARLHDGEVEIDSQPGRGTAVTVVLPASRVQAATLPATAGA